MLHQRPNALTASSAATLFANAMPDPRRLPISKQVLGKATRFLARHVRTKTLTGRDPKPLVSFTFDDVLLSACTTGARILERHGSRGTFYVSGGGCGTPSPCGLLASVEQVASLSARGHEIGCHTYAHPGVSNIAPEALRADLDRNASFLKSALSGLLPRNFAYPYGDQTFRAKRYLQSRFDSCRSLVPGINVGTTDLGTLKSYCMAQATRRDELDALIAEAVHRRGWLIFAGHDVDEAPSPFGVTPDFLDYAITAAKAAGCEIVTIAGALAAMAGSQTRSVAP